MYFGTSHIIALLTVIRYLPTCFYNLFTIDVEVRKEDNWNPFYVKGPNILLILVTFVF